MSQYGELSAYQQVLHRPRLNALIRDGLKQPLLVMIAGPGYGKTFAMSNYAMASDMDILWLRCGMLDNLPSHFWDHLLRVLVQKSPELSDHFYGLEFPDTINSFEIFARILANNVCNRRGLIWVFDDYGEINNQQVKNFTRMLVESGIDNFHLVLLSNALYSTESIAFMTHKRSLLLADDLRFTRDEIRELFQLHGITLEADELDETERYTGGWPLPLRLLAQQRDRMSEVIRRKKKVTLHTISHMFEERFFSSYPRAQQKLLVKLSMLESFTKAFAISLYNGEATDLEPLGNHAFLLSVPGSDHYYLHHLYRTYLREKAYLLNVEEERLVWRKAAAFYISEGKATEAIDCYRNAKDYQGMMEAVYRYIMSQSEITESTALYFLNHMTLLTCEQLEANPRIDFIRAYVHMILVQLEEAEALLDNLEGRLQGTSTLEDHDLLCDLYTTQALIHMMKNQEDFVDIFQKAAQEAEYLPQEILAGKSGKLRLLNAHAFSMADNQPGAKQRMEKATYDAIPYMTKIWSGDISGLEYLFSAESAYLSYQMEGARQYAYQCFYKAEAYAQHDLACNAYRLLTRIGFLQGDLTEAKRQIDNVVDYAARHDSSVMRNIRDTALAWYYIKMRDFEKIPQSILELSKTEVHTLSYGRPQVTYAHYLLNTGAYARLVGMMQHTDKGLYLSRGIWQERIVRQLMLMVGYHGIGDLDKSMDALWAAYDMCYHNGLVTLFIEAGTHMVKAIQVARQQRRYIFAPEWLDYIEKEAQAYAKRTDKVRVAYRRGEPLAPTESNPLSRREKEVLQAIARGLTREEIAAEQYISVNTVKSTARSIFNKLDASNKAEAVSIAISKGFIE